MRKITPKKIVDDYTEVKCSSGLGVIREEVWQDENGAITKYNLAFINFSLFAKDSGRVLGYDNNHGYHHRHFKGVVTEFKYVSYDVLLDQFLDEVRKLRKEKA